MTGNNTSASSSSSTTTRKQPMFQKQHHDAITELIGQKIVYGIVDEEDYSIIEAFAEMFAEDNPTMFDKDKFRDAVYDAHSKRRKE
ncbi:MAG TPA: hypothetical protein VJ551_02470 [Nitrososphaeraceae archaeon]|nr:hypothetical protein [Nitrososphaeraceae archaeon]